MDFESLRKESFQKEISKFEQQNEERMKEYKNRWRSITESAAKNLMKAGWTLPMKFSMKPLEYVSHLDIPQIDDFFYTFFTYDDNRHLKELINDVMKSGIDEKYKLAFNQCVNAFDSEMYILIINTLLVIIEGVLSSIYPDKKNIHMIKVCKSEIEELTSEDDFIKKVSWESYLSFITILYAKSDFDDNEPNFINRHWLLHGRSSYDVSIVDCIRLFNAVSTICYVVNKDRTL